MRAPLLALAVLLIAAPCQAQQIRSDFAHPRDTLRMPNDSQMYDRKTQARVADLPVSLWPFQPRSEIIAPLAPMRIGPIETEFANGHTSYRLEGRTLLGGGVSGTVDGRGAEIFLRWPNN